MVNCVVKYRKQRSKHGRLTIAWTLMHRLDSRFNCSLHADLSRTGVSSQRFAGSWGTETIDRRGGINTKDLLCQDSFNRIPGTPDSENDP
jgi:hypothetical protein